MFNYLKAKHPVAHTKAVLKECSTQKQTTLGTFATTCPPAQANRITTLITKSIARDSDATIPRLNFKLKGGTNYLDICLLGHPD